MVAHVALVAMMLALSTLTSPARASEEAWQRIAITPAEAAVLRDWQKRRGHVVAPVSGAQVRSGLVATATLAAPVGPGLRRGERLNLDVYKSGTRLPGELLAQLPEQPRGTMLMELDGQVIRVFRPTRTVVDVLR